MAIVRLGLGIRENREWSLARMGVEFRSEL